MTQTREETKKEMEKKEMEKKTEAQNAYPCGEEAWEDEPLVREAQAAYRVKRQGEYTLEDYYALPDDQRVELIDGVIYDMSSPLSVHQLLTGKIHFQLLQYVEKNGGSCMPMISPMDVQLDMDNRTMVEPDVLVVCDRSKVKRRCIYGAPDFVVEVLSESTKKKDMFLKLNKYQNAGVREYWMVDPKSKRVIVYELEKEEGPVIYGFDAKIPVGIYDGKCVIDFEEIYQSIEFLYHMEDEPDEE